jgi:hypothetical protein
VVNVAPPLTLTYIPSAAELDLAGGDVGRIELAESTSVGWQPLVCSRVQGSLTCSLPQLGTIAALVAPPAAEPADVDVPTGHFYKQGNGFGAGGELGYSIVDDAAAPLWSEFQRRGGVDTLGYPISARFVYDGSITQVFQRAALQWQPRLGETVFVDMLDALSANSADSWLDAHLQIPPRQDWSADISLSSEDVYAAHLAVLDDYPDLRGAVVADGSLDLYGLPTAVKQYGPTLVVRFQRGTLQVWTEDTSLAPAGTQLWASGAQLGRQLGQWPASAMVPQATPLAITP